MRMVRLGWLSGGLLIVFALSLEVLHFLLPSLLVRRRRTIAPDGTPFFAPSIEDELLLQGLQKVVGRTSFRIADAAAAIAALRTDGLDWRYLLAAAHRLDLLEPLGAFLGYVEQIHRNEFATPLLPAAIREALPLGGWGDVAFHDGLFRFPGGRVTGLVYLHRLGRVTRARQWRDAGRLSLLPLVAVAAGVGRLTLRRTR